MYSVIKILYKNYKTISDSDTTSVHISRTPASRCRRCPPQAARPLGGPRPALARPPRPGKPPASATRRAQSWAPGA